LVSTSDPEKFLRIKKKVANFVDFCGEEN
jgi:hypothetical protein